MSAAGDGGSGARPITVSLWHPFTARSIGWSDEADLARVHSRPHVEALVWLERERGDRCRVEYLTDRLLPRSTRGEIARRFWPRTTRWRRASAKFRWEWSTPGLLAAVIAPADVTIINMSGHGSPFGRALARVVRWRGRSYIAMVGGLHATLDGPQLRFFEHAAVVAVHNRELAGRVLAAGLQSDRVQVVPLGIDAELFAPDPRAEPVGVPTLLYVGRFQESKGLDLMLSAAAELAATHRGLRVRLVGPGHDSPYGDRLRAQAGRLGIADALVIEPAVAHHELAAIYRAASVFVLPSANEGFGMVLPEAMASGVPVVALAGAGGPSDIVDDGVDGLLATPESLTHAIASILADDDRRAAMGRAGRAKVLDRYTTDVTNRAIADLVDRAVRSSRAR